MGKRGQIYLLTVLKSKHLDQDGKGSYAMDVIDTRWGYDDSSKDAQQFFKEYGAVGKKEDLIWGGDFGKKNPRTGYGWDPGHLEFKTDKNIKENK